MKNDRMRIKQIFYKEKQRRREKWNGEMDYSHKEKRQEEKSEIVSWIISTKRKREK